MKIGRWRTSEGGVKELPEDILFGEQRPGVLWPPKLKKPKQQLQFFESCCGEMSVLWDGGRKPDASS